MGGNVSSSEQDVQQEVKSIMNTSQQNLYSNLIKRYIKATNEIIIFKSQNVNFSYVEQRNMSKVETYLQVALQNAEALQLTEKQLQEIKQKQKQGGLFNLSVQNQKVKSKLTNVINTEIVNKVINEVIESVDTSNRIQIDQSSDVIFSRVNQVNEHFNFLVHTALLDLASQNAVQLDQTQKPIQESESGLDSSTLLILGLVVVAGGGLYYYSKKSPASSAAVL